MARWWCGGDADPPTTGGEPVDDLEAKLGVPLLLGTLPSLVVAPRFGNRIPQKWVEADRGEAEDEVHRAAEALRLVMLDLYHRQEKVVLARLTGVKARRGTRHWDTGKAVTGLEKKIDPRYVLDLAKWKDLLDAAVRPVMTRLVDGTYGRVRDWLKRRGTPVQGDPPQYAKDQVVEDAIQTLGDAVALRGRQVQDLVDQGEANGDPLPVIEGTIVEFYDRNRDRWAENDADVAVRSLHRATTEAASHAVGAGGARVERMWLSQRDKKVRAEHQEADGQWRDVRSPFTVGGVPMMYPGDATAPLHLWVNCRCALVLRVANALY